MACHRRAPHRARRTRARRRPRRRRRRARRGGGARDDARRRHGRGRARGIVSTDVPQKDLVVASPLDYHCPLYVVALPLEPRVKSLPVLSASDTCCFCMPVQRAMPWLHWAAAEKLRVPSPPPPAGRRGRAPAGARARGGARRRVRLFSLSASQMMRWCVCAEFVRSPSSPSCLSQAVWVPSLPLPPLPPLPRRGSGGAVLPLLSRMRQDASERWERACTRPLEARGVVVADAAAVSSDSRA